MSQHNTPGNEPNHGRDDGDAPSNPYYGQNVADNNPNLDAAAPQLRSAEEQRLNRGKNLPKIKEVIMQTP